MTIEYIAVERDDYPGFDLYHDRVSSDTYSGTVEGGRADVREACTTMERSGEVSFQINLSFAEAPPNEFLGYARCYLHGLYALDSEHGCPDCAERNRDNEEAAQEHDALRREAEAENETASQYAYMERDL